MSNKNTTLIAALSLEGMGAAMILEGSAIAAILPLKKGRVNMAQSLSTPLYAL